MKNIIVLIALFAICESVFAQMFPFKKKEATWEEFRKALELPDTTKEWKAYMYAPPSVILAEYARRLDEIDGREGNRYKPFTPMGVLLALDSFTQTEKLVWKKGQMNLGYLNLSGAVQYWQRASYGGSNGEFVKTFLGWPVVSMECGNSMMYVTAPVATTSSQSQPAHAFVPPASNNQNPNTGNGNNQGNRNRGQNQQQQQVVTVGQSIPEATPETNGFLNPQTRNAFAELEATRMWAKNRYTGNDPVIGSTGVRRPVENPPVIGPTGVRIYPRYYRYGVYVHRF